jgi:hypothetical protein
MLARLSLWLLASSLMATVVRLRIMLGKDINKAAILKIENN